MPQTRAMSRAAQDPSGTSAAPRSRGHGSSTAANGTPRKARAPANGKRPVQLQLPLWLAPALAILAWCVSSSARMFVNKQLFRSGFPYPLAATATWQTVSFLGALALGRTQKYRIVPCSSWQQYASAGLPTALCTVGTLYTGNYGIMNLSVSFVQMVKGLTPSITLVLAVLMGSETLSLSLAATVSIISLGSAVSCIQQGAMPDFHVSGFIAQVRPALLLRLCKVSQHACARSVNSPLLDEAAGGRSHLDGRVDFHQSRHCRAASRYHPSGAQLAAGWLYCQHGRETGGASRAGKCRWRHASWRRQGRCQ